MLCMLATILRKCAHLLAGVQWRRRGGWVGPDPPPPPLMTYVQTPLEISAKPLNSFVIDMGV